MESKDTMEIAMEIAMDRMEMRIKKKLEILRMGGRV